MRYGDVQDISKDNEKEIKKSAMREFEIRLDEQREKEAESNWKTIKGRDFYHEYA